MSEESSKINKNDNEDKCNDSTDVSDTSVDKKGNTSGSAKERKDAENVKENAPIDLACESRESTDLEAEDSKEDILDKSSEKENDSSLRLVMDNTPDVITKIPESQQFSEGESMGVTSQSSTIEIDSTETTAEKGSSISTIGAEESIQKNSSLRREGKDSILRKSIPEDDQSLHISQDEIFGSNAGVVSSTPQSVNPRLLLKDDEEMIPSSPEDKRLKSSSLLPALHGGPKYLKRERRGLSLGRSPKKTDRSKADGVEEFDPGEKSVCSDSESEETQLKGMDEDAGIGNCDESERPKSGMKRKFDEILMKGGDSETPSTKDSGNSEDHEVEVLEIKKSRKSIEVVYSKNMNRSSRKYSSPTKRSRSSRLSGSSSSQSSSSSSLLGTTPRQQSLPPEMSSVQAKKRKLTPQSEELCDEEFTLHISPSEGSQCVPGNSEQLRLPEETFAKDMSSTSAMSTIMEVDERHTADSPIAQGGGDTVTVSDIKEEEKDPVAEVLTDCEITGGQSSCEAIRPSSPEYLSDDQSKSWIASVAKSDEIDNKDTDNMLKRVAGDLTPLHKVEHSVKHNNSSAVKACDPLNEPSQPTTTVEKERTAECIPDPASDLIRNGDPEPNQIHECLVFRVCHQVDSETRQITSTKILEMYASGQESIKESPKGKICGRVSDVSKTSSVESKSSAFHGDISSPPNTISPQSMSGEGKLFPLPPTRASIMSTFSHSSSSTSGSDMVLNPKALEALKFTKPYQPLSILRLKGLEEAFPELKPFREVNLTPASKLNETSDVPPDSRKSRLEQAFHEYFQKEVASNSVMPQDRSEDASKSQKLSGKRYLNARGKSKRPSLRMKRKGSSSSRTTPPINPPCSQNNIEEQDTLPLDESLSNGLVARTPKSSSSISEPLTERKTRVRDSRGRTSRSSQSKGSQQTSENSLDIKSSNSSQLGSPPRNPTKTDIPTTPLGPCKKQEFPGIVFEGALVFAQFSDKWYYPGKAAQKQRDNRWLIDFDDGKVKPIKEDHLVVVPKLEQGQSVYAAVDDSCCEYESGMITKIEMKKTQVLYTVELDNRETLVLPRSRLCLTEDQVGLLRELVDNPLLATPKQQADVSLDNVLEGKRTRGRKTESLASNSPIRCIAGPSKSSSIKKHNPVIHDSSSFVSTSETSESGFEGLSGVEPSISPQPILTSADKGKGPKRRKGRSKQLDMNISKPTVPEPSLESSCLIDELGPIPPSGSTIFKGRYFILNYSTRVANLNKKRQARKCYSDLSSDAEGTDTCDESRFPYEKNHLKKQLEAGGGKVFLRYSDECRGKQCFIISNWCNLTADYLLAISSDIQSVSHEWVIHCCTKGESLPLMENLLPVGWSIEMERNIEWHERSEEALKDVEVVLASNSGKSFLRFWGQVLMNAGAHVRKVTSENISSQEDISYVRVIVTDENCPSGILECASETKVPIVSTMWVKQSIIHGKMRPFIGHLWYKWDHKFD